MLIQKLANVLGTVLSEFTFQHVAPKKEKEKKGKKRKKDIRFLTRS